jgi:hypothetical protein
LLLRAFCCASLFTGSRKMRCCIPESMQRCGHELLYHTGGNQGFFISMSRYVDDRLTIIVLNNLDEYHCDTLRIAGDVASIYIPETEGANPIKDW